MNLTSRELEKLQILTLAMVAQNRKDRGLKLNFPESVAIISAAVLEAARDGLTVEQSMEVGGQALTVDDVMEGVTDLVPYIQIEAVFTDGSRLVTIHNPIK